MLKQLFEKLFGKKKEFNPYGNSLQYFQTFTYTQYPTVNDHIPDYVSSKAQDLFDILHNLSKKDRANEISWYVDKIAEMAWHMSGYIKDKELSSGKEALLEYIFMEFEYFASGCGQLISLKGDKKEEQKEILFYKILSVNEILRNCIGRNDLKSLYVLIMHIGNSHYKEYVIECIFKIMSVEKTDEERLLELMNSLKLS
ncbi:MAG: hypothetical protein N2749_00330 [Clostridia bacterium]|nr:hypothetical protein [Clostridia bacterium]